MKAVIYVQEELPYVKYLSEMGKGQHSPRFYMGSIVPAQLLLYYFFISGLVIEYSVAKSRIIKQYTNEPVSIYSLCVHFNTSAFLVKIQLTSFSRITLNHGEKAVKAYTSVVSTLTCNLGKKYFKFKGSASFLSTKCYHFSCKLNAMKTN